jgi:hypothetical protein
MRKLLVAILLASALATGVSAAEDYQSQLVGSALRYYHAAQIFIGPDRDMPLDGSFLFAMQPPKTRSGDFLAPTTLIGAFRQLRKFLPHWFLKGLIDSEGDLECMVVIQHDLSPPAQQDYAGPLEDWIWIYWNLESSRSPLRKEISSFHIGEGDVEYAFWNGFCSYVKTGDEKAAMEEVASFNWR